MHAFHTIPIAQAASANAAIIAAFGPVGQTFSVPLYAADALDDSTPIRMACAPEYTDPEWQSKLAALDAAFPEATTALYDLAKNPPDADPVAGVLAALGLRKALSHSLP